MLKWSFLVAFLFVLAVPRAVSYAASGTMPDQAPRYDPATVKEFTGVVEAVREDDRSAPLPGIHLMVKDEKDSFDVYLAPVSFLKLFDVEFAKGDQVQVVGSRVKRDGDTIVLAKEVRRGDTTVYLRDDQGKPFWIH